jgi:hypothetical protein
MALGRTHQHAHQFNLHRYGHQFKAVVKMGVYVKKAVKLAYDDRENAVLPVWESAKKGLPFEHQFQAYLWVLRGGLVGVTPLLYVAQANAAVTMDQVLVTYDSIEQDL